MNLKRIIFSNWFIAILLTMLCLAGQMMDFSPLQRVENLLYDQLEAKRHPKINRPLLLVTIDQESLQGIGPWPWPRTRIVEILQSLQAAGAKTIGLDLLFGAREVNEGLYEIKKMRLELSEKNDGASSQLTRKLKEAENRIDTDAHLLAALDHGNKIILPLRFSMGRGRTPALLPKWLNDHSTGMIPDSGKKLTVTLPFRPPWQADLAKNELIAFLYHPYLDLAERAKALGHDNFPADTDGTVRADTLLITYQDRIFPSMGLQLALDYSGAKFSSLKAVYSASGIALLTAGGLEIPVTDGNRLLLNFEGDQPLFETVSAQKLMTDGIKDDSLKDRLVLVGITAPELTTYQVVPNGAKLAPVELIATSAANIIGSSSIFRPDWAWFLEVAALLWFGIFLAFIIPRVNISLGAVILGIFIVTWQFSAILVFTTYGLWLKSATPTLLAVVGFIIIFMMRKILGTDRQNEHAESNKMLGLSLQSQGLLDMAFEKFMKCPIKDTSVKDLLYNLGLDFERKRMLNKAAAVYKHILSSGDFKDIKERIKKLEKTAAMMPISMGSTSGDSTISFDASMTTPTLGRYEVIRELGQGAIGTVYLGRDPKINREVAIKTLRYNEVDPADLDEVKQRFVREAEAAGKLNHPNIITIYDIGEDHDITYLAMELLTGKDLSNNCRIGCLLPTRKVIEVIIKVAEALDYAHKNNVVHRDIKPANIIMQGDGQVKVADFGIARILTSSQTKTGVVLGTPNYMSPEQVAGRKVDGQSDLFSLGIVFYELLSGIKPFQNENVATLMHLISTAVFEPLDQVAPETPSCCVEIVHKLMAKAKTRRYKTAAEVADEAKTCLQSLRR